MIYFVLYVGGGAVYVLVFPYQQITHDIWLLSFGIESVRLQHFFAHFWSCSGISDCSLVSPECHTSHVYTRVHTCTHVYTLVHTCTHVYTHMMYVGHFPARLSIHRKYILRDALLLIYST